MKQHAPRKRSAAEGGDETYLGWIRSLPCCVCQAPAPNHPHHSTGAGMALKAPDREAMPLCHRCHRDFHDGRGWAEYMGKRDRRVWQEVQVERCQYVYSTIGDLPIRSEMQPPQAIT